MKRLVFLRTLALATIALVLSVPAANAAEERPFQATVVMPLLGWDADGNWVYRGTVNMPHWGNTTHLARVDIPKKTKDPATGTITVYFGNGDTVCLAFGQFWDETEGCWMGEYWVTGGTGKFAAAAGGGMITTAPGEGGTAVVTYDGVVSY